MIFVATFSFGKSLLRQLMSSGQSSTGTTNSSFNFRLVKQYMQECNENNLDLNSYVKMYGEFNKMFGKFGRVFSMVTAEINEKTAILKKHMESNSADNYQAVETMLDYESNNNLIKTNPVSNGARTFLRLHRALDFVLCIVDGVKNSKENDSMAELVRQAYDKTLGTFHPWYLRSVVHVALRILPNRKQFIADISADISPEEASSLMADVVVDGRKIYDRCQKLYQDRNMLSLP